MKTIEELNQFIGEFFKSPIRSNNVCIGNWIDFITQSGYEITFWEDYCIHFDLSDGPFNDYDKIRIHVLNICTFMDVSFIETTVAAHDKIIPNFFFDLTDDQKLEYRMMYFS